MQTITLTQTGTGTSGVRALSYFTNPFNIGLGTKVTGSATYTVEVCFDDPMDPTFDANTATWYGVTGLTGVTANVLTALTIPCKGVRVNVSTGSGSVTLYIEQAGTR